MDNFKVAGIASGFDWMSMVDQLMEIERAPQQRMRTEQTANTKKKDALDTLGTKLSTLQSRINALNNASLYRSKSVGLGDKNVGISASASTTATEGKYAIQVTQLATASKRFGATDVGGSMGDANTALSALRLATDITAGRFTVNGQQISVAATDTLEEVFDAIAAATSGVVTGSYDSVSDRVTLTSASGELRLGAADDDSNLLKALRLEQLEVTSAGGGSSQVSSSRALGVVDLDSSIAASGIGGVAGSGAFYINGVAIQFDADTESIKTLMARVNASSAGVTMSYDSANDQFRLVNKETGAYEMPVIDSGNGLMAALGLTGTADIGSNLKYSIDGAAVQEARGNTISTLDHGIEGVTFTATSEGTQTVTISRDSAELKTKINEFVSAFNDVQDFIQEKTKISVSDGNVTAGVLAGNREISSLDSQLRRLAFGSVDGLSGDLFRLEHLGIDFKSGTSKLEVKKADALEAALAGKLETLESFFKGDAASSFSGRMDAYIKNFTASGGVLGTQQETLTKRNSSIDTQIAEMERRLASKRSALEASFIAMEEAQSKINNMSQALAGLTF